MNEYLDGPDREFVYVQGYGFTDGPRKPDMNSMIRVYSNALGCTLIAFLALQNFVPLVVVMLMRMGNPAIRIYNNQFIASSDTIEVISIWSSLICYCLPILLLCAFLHLGAHTVFPRRLPRAGEALPAAGLVLASSVIGSMVAMLLSALLALVNLHPTGPGLSEADNVRSLMLAAASSALMPAIFEELLFRGAILQSLRRFGEPFALFCSTLLFALLHRNLVQFPNAFITGMLLGFLALRTGTLLVPMLCHFINNLVPLLLNFFLVGLPEESVSRAYIGLNVVYLAAGVVGALYLLRTRPQFFTPLHRDVPRAERRKLSAFFGSVPLLAVVVLLVVQIILNLF